MPQDSSGAGAILDQAIHMIEICIDSVASARTAHAGGADRVELCANLPEGGTTPSAGMIRVVRSAFSGKLMVIIRPRGYDFLFSEDEMEVMLEEIRTAANLGADGVVIGCLRPDGTVDRERCSRLLEAAAGMDVTFHRAFDMTRDLTEALEDIAALGIRRVLSSGGRQDAIAGADVLAALVRQANGRVSIMPGGGVTEDNISKIIRATGACEIHLTARAKMQSGMSFRNLDCFMGIFSKFREFEWSEASEIKIRLAKQRMTAALR